MKKPDAAIAPIAMPAMSQRAGCGAGAAGGSRSSIVGSTGNARDVGIPDGAIDIAEGASELPVVSSGENEDAASTDDEDGGAATIDGEDVASIDDDDGAGGGIGTTPCDGVK